MKKGFMLAATAVALSQVFAFGSAQAATTTGYDSTNDTHVNLGAGGIGTLLPGLGDTLYQTQEGLYQTTGTSVNHDYVWVSVDGTPVLAVDPPKPIFNW